MGSERWVEDSKSKATEQNTQWTKGCDTSCSEEKEQQISQERQTGCSHQLHVNMYQEAIIPDTV